MNQPILWTAIAIGIITFIVLLIYCCKPSCFNINNTKEGFPRALRQNLAKNYATYGSMPGQASFIGTSSGMGCNTDLSKAAWTSPYDLQDFSTNEIKNQAAGLETFNNMDYSNMDYDNISYDNSAYNYKTFDVKSESESNQETETKIKSALKNSNTSCGRAYKAVALDGNPRIDMGELQPVQTCINRNGDINGWSNNYNKARVPNDRCTGSVKRSKDTMIRSTTIDPSIDDRGGLNLASIPQTIETFDPTCSNSRLNGAFMNVQSFLGTNDGIHSPNINRPSFSPDLRPGCNKTKVVKN